MHSYSPFQAGSTASDAACFHSPILRAEDTSNTHGNFLPGYSMSFKYLSHLHAFSHCFMCWGLQRIPSAVTSKLNIESLFITENAVWYCFSAFNPVLIYSCWIAKASGKWEEGPLFALKCSAAPLISPSGWESLHLSDQYDPVMTIFSVVKSLQILTFFGQSHTVLSCVVFSSNSSSLQRSYGCPIPGGAQCQAGWGPGQPSMVGGNQPIAEGWNWIGLFQPRAILWSRNGVQVFKTLPLLFI